MFRKNGFNLENLLRVYKALLNVIYTSGQNERFRYLGSNILFFTYFFKTSRVRFLMGTNYECNLFLYTTI